jgi:signal transduction histidine kinase/ligand-binding sensor domain-containing protein
LIAFFPPFSKRSFPAIIMRTSIHLPFSACASAVVRVILALLIFALAGTTRQTISLRAQTQLRTLPDKELTCALQDKYGFLWFGSESGLHRWDGVEMRSFRGRAEDARALPSTAINHIMEDRKGELWIASNGGLSQFHRRDESFSTHLRGKPVAFAFADGARGIWAYCREPGLASGEIALVLDSGEERLWKSFGEGRAIFATAYAAHKGENGEVWIGAGNGAHLFTNGAKPAWQTFLADGSAAALSQNARSRVSALAFANNGDLYIGTSGGLLRRARGNKEILPVQGAENARVLAIFPLPSDGGVIAVVAESVSARGAAIARAFRVESDAVREASKETLELTPLADKPQDMRAWSDAGGETYWGVAEGIVALNARPARLRFAHFAGKAGDGGGARNALNAPVTQIFRERFSQTLWWTRLGAGAFTNARLRPIFETPAKDARERIARAGFSTLFADRAGSLWLGADNAATSLRYNPARGDMSAILHETVETRIGAFAETRSGETLAAGVTLERLRADARGFARAPFAPTQRRLIATALAETPDGTLWLGTEFGLYKKESPKRGEPETVFQPLFAADANAADQTNSANEKQYKSKNNDNHSGARPSRNGVRALAVGGDGRLWIAHDAGLDVYASANQLFTHIPLAGEPTSLAVGGARGDTLWVGTRERGLVCLNAASGAEICRRFHNESVLALQIDARGNPWICSRDAVCALDRSSGAERRYDSRDGLPADELLERAIARAGDELRSAIFTLHPDSLTLNSEPPPVLLTGVKKFGRPAVLENYLPDMESLVLTHDETIVSFEFTAMNFIQSAKNRYAYMLEDFDRDWNDAGESREAKYTNLPAGEYVFRVKAANNDGVWNADGASLRVIVLPPWWATLWFRGGALLALVSGIFWTHRARARALEERNRVLETTVAERTRALKEAQAQLVQSERLNAAGMLTAGVMHEINNPNAALMAAVQLAAMELSDAERYFAGLLDEEDRASPAAERFSAYFRSVGESLEVALDSSKRIKNIVAALQGFTKHQRVGAAVQSVDEEIARTIDIARYQFNAVEFIRCIPPELRLEAEWNELNQAFLNLLVNAAQAGATRITVSAEERDGAIVVSVSDNGEGMTEEVKNRIFEPFFTTKDVGNSGLGLSITKNILAQHGANIDFESERGKGTTARIWFV